MTKATKLRNFARLKPCMVRLTAVCNFDPETTVLAHIRRGGVGGTGMKPPDTCAVWACSACHDAIDRRTKVNDTDLDADILAALCRQLAYYDRHEILTVCL